MKKPLSSFFALSSVFAFALIAIKVLSLLKIGLLVTTGIALLFSVMVYRLPRFVYQEDKRNKSRLAFSCTIGSVCTFVCLTAFSISPEDVKRNYVIHDEEIKMFQCVLVAAYVATALIVSKLYEKEEKSRYSSNNPTKSHPVYK